MDGVNGLGRMQPGPGEKTVYRHVIPGYYSGFYSARYPGIFQRYQAIPFSVHIAQLNG